jgi:hypothetical protein
MWLIETESLKLEYFIGDLDSIPRYAILSHTWGDGEVTFQDWQDLQRASKKPGFEKIKSACAQAQADSIDYIWIDTNCIDKSSSAELSEAINSMFAWYRDSYICYIYLADVEDPDDVAAKLGDDTEDLDWESDADFDDPKSVKDINHTTFINSIRKSRWFTRGWTLQELLAPTSLRFLTRDWKPISMDPSSGYNVNPDAKIMQESLLELLSDITGIRTDILISPPNVPSCSIGEKMSWMSGRETTRVEDLAYCLLGIFDINMPLLYGEGSKAFTRLQEEIAKQSTDHSLFAWQWPQAGPDTTEGTPNLFAESAKPFSNFDRKLLGYGRQFDDIFDEGDDNNPLSTILSLTNFGLSSNFELIPTADSNYVFGALKIVAKDGFRNPRVLPERELWCIPLQKVGQVYYRAPFPPGPFPVRTRRKRCEYSVHVPRKEYSFLDRIYLCQYAFVILFPDLEIGTGFKVSSLSQIGHAVLSPHQSTISIPHGCLQNGRMASSILSVQIGETWSILLHIKIREVNDSVETAAKLFHAETPLKTVKSTEVPFRPPSFYCDEYGSVSLVVSKGHRVDPLPGESGSGTIFSVSLYISKDIAHPTGEVIAGSESEEASEVDSEETSESESDGEIS